MSAWSADDLQRVGDATELQLASRRSDGTLTSYTTMWVVRVGDDLYVRSAGGPTCPWYRRGLANGNGRVRGGGIERDVVFGDAPAVAPAAIDGAYHAKYDSYGPRIVGSVVGPDRHAVTIRLVSTEP